MAGAHDLLVQKIYDAADRPEGLTAVVPAIGELLDARVAQTLIIEHGAVVEQHGIGYDPRAFVEYTERWIEKDPRFAHAIANLGHAHSDVIALDRAAFERTEIYNEHLVPSDGEYTLFGTFPASGSIVLGQAFLRGRRMQPFGREEVEHLHALAPHLGRAAYLRQLLRAARAERDELRSALDALPNAIAILDGTSRVVCANDAAERLFRESPTLRTVGGVLTSLVPEEARAIGDALAAAATAADAGRGARARAPTGFLAFGRDGGETLVLKIFPLRPRNVVRERGARSARVLVVFAHEAMDRKGLPDRFVDLPPSLRAVAELLKAGASDKDIASALGMPLPTVRTYVTRVFARLGVRSRRDLMR